LRRALRDRIPESVLARRDKMGFETPVDLWLRGRFAAEALRRLTQPGPLWDWLDPGAVASELDAYLDGSREIGLQVWRWLSLDSWARQYLARDPRVTARPRELSPHPGRHQAYAQALAILGGSAARRGIARGVGRRRRGSAGSRGRSVGLVDLLALAEVRWSYFRTRKQFLLSRFPERWRVFYAQPPGSGADDPWTPRREGNVTVFTVPFLKPATTSAPYNAGAATSLGRAAIERAAVWSLESTLAKLGLARDAVLFVSNVYAARALERVPHRLAVYDFNDSPFQFAGSPRWARTYWDRTRAHIDLFFAVSEHYRRQLAQETDRPVITVGNGVEFARFATPRPRCPRPAAARASAWAALHFLDFETLEAIRAARPGQSGAHGPAFRGTSAPLAELARVEVLTVLGTVPY
jgi:hypothetical protein